MLHVSGAPVVHRHPLAGLYRINAYSVTADVREQLMTFKKANLSSLRDAAERQRQQPDPGASYADAKLATVKLEIAKAQEAALEAAHKVRLPPSGITFSCGINISGRARQGLLLYKAGRLVHTYKPVGLQRLQDPWHDCGCGGVVCVVDIPDETLETTPYYDRLLRSEVRTRFCGLALFCRPL